MELKKEDYEEPRCLICDPATGKPERKKSTVDLRRVAEKLDELCAEKDFSGAERHLKYWLEDARYSGDQRGEFGVLNEMIGFYRKQENRDAAYDASRKALELIAQLDNGDTISAATCYVNCGTAYDAFGDVERALPMFERAREIYEGNLNETDSRLAGLYNNMALVLVALRRFGEADRMYQRALEILEQDPEGKPERAITLLNMANAVEAEHGLEKSEEKIASLLNEAADLLDAPDNNRSAYYAYVCERCAPTFDYYGFFFYANEIRRRAKEI